jgi:hypothetical protein
MVQRAQGFDEEEKIKLASSTKTSGTTSKQKLSKKNIRRTGKSINLPGKGSAEELDTKSIVAKFADSIGQAAQSLSGSSEPVFSSSGEILAADSKQQAQNITEGSTLILNNPKVKEAAKNFAKESKAVIGAPKAIIKEAAKNLDNPSKIAEIAQKEQVGQKQSTLSDTFTAALVHFTPMLLGGLLAGDEGVAIGGAAGQQALARNEESRRAEQAAQLDQAKLEQQESQFSRSLEQQESMFNRRIASTERLTKLKAGLDSQLEKQKAQSIAQKLTIANTGLGGSLENVQILSKERLPKLIEKASSFKNVTTALNRILEIGASADPVKRALIDQEASTLIGQLRISLVGPGPMTDSERDFVKGIIGNPNKIFSLNAIEIAKVKNLINNVTNTFKTDLLQNSVQGLRIAGQKQMLQKVQEEKARRAKGK